MPTYTGLSVFSDLLLVRGAFWGNGLAASCTLQTPLPGGRSCIIRTGAEAYSLNCRIPSRRVLLENRASGIRASRKSSLSCVALRALCGRYPTQDYLGNLKGIERKKAGVERPGRKVVGLGF